MRKGQERALRRWRVAALAFAGATHYIVDELGKGLGGHKVGGRLAVRRHAHKHEKDLRRWAEGWDPCAKRGRTGRTGLRDREETDLAVEGRLELLEVGWKRGKRIDVVRPGRVAQVRVEKRVQAVVKHDLVGGGDNGGAVREINGAGGAGQRCAGDTVLF